MMRRAWGVCIGIWVLGLSAQALAQAQPDSETPSTGSDLDDGEASDASEFETDAVPSNPTLEDTDHAVRLRGLEEQVNELKERVFRSKARLLLLRETVLNGVISGARARIVHRNNMGSAFRLEEVQYALDGSPLLNRIARGNDLDRQKEIELFDGSIVPGNHNLSVYLLFRGNGYGVFSYLKGYIFKVRSSYAFVAEEGKVTNVRAVAYEKGGFTTDLQDRVAIRYDVETKQDVRTDEELSESDDAASDAEEAEAPTPEGSEPEP
ncbi:MAG: dihydrolipoamide acetyltransferase [Myxococcota bacterium]